MNKPKIAFLIHQLKSGGAERVITTLSNSLVKYYDVHIILFVAGEPYYSVSKDVKILTCSTDIIPSKNIFYAIRNNYSLIRRINTHIKVNRIGLLISFLTTANVLGTIASKLNRIPVIISERNNPARQELGFFWDILRRITYPYASYLIVQTPTIKNYFKNKINRNKLNILPNPISPLLTSKRDNLMIRENIILSVGSLTPQKAQHILVKAFAITNRNDWKLIIIGEGPLRSELESLVKRLNLEDKVVLPGQKKNIYDYYNQASIFAFTSIYEGFPNALIEALHFGLPCITTDCPTGPSELIEDGTNGFLVPINDVKIIADKLNLLMHNHNILKKFRYHAAASVEEFETKNVIVKWKNLIDNCLSD